MARRKGKCGLVFREAAMPPLSWQGGALFDTPTETMPPPAMPPESRKHASFIPGIHTYSDELEQALKVGVPHPWGYALEYVARNFLASLTERTRAKGEKSWREGFSPIDFENDYRVGTIVRALEKKFGITGVSDILGRGSFGVASAIDDTRVLKLTVDGSEVQSGALLMGHNLPHVAKVYGAYWIKNVSVQKTSESSMRKAGVLILERLNRVAPGSAYRLYVEYTKFRQAHPEVGFQELKKRSYEEARALMDRASNDLTRTFTNIDDPMVLDVGEAVQELRDIGIFAIDVHSGNVGWSEQDQRYKLFDIGVSSVPREAKPTAIVAEMAPCLMPRTYVEEI